MADTADARIAGASPSATRERSAHPQSQPVRKFLYLDLRLHYHRSMSVPFDPERYRRAPILGITDAITLGHALITEAPTPPPAFVQKALTNLTNAVNTANEVLGRRQGKVTESGRPLDQEADASWSGFRDRLQGYASLPADRYPRALRAAQLIDILFGTEGLSFLRLPYTQQWSVMGAILGRIDRENLAADINLICGPEFLEQLRDVQGRYGQMIERLLKQSGEESVREPLRVLRQAITRYAEKMLASIEDDEPDTIEQARTALEPIDAYRDRQTKRFARSGEAEPAEPPAPGSKPQPAPTTPQTPPRQASPAPTPPAPTPSTPTPPQAATATATAAPAPTAAAGGASSGEAKSEQAPAAPAKPKKR